MTEQFVLGRREIVAGAALSGLAVAAPAQTSTQDSVAAVKALIDSYQKAFSTHDMAGVLGLFSPNALVVGTGPGEIWAGTAEIRGAYTRFFELFDKGKQKYEPLFTDGHVRGDMAWLVSMTKMSFSKGTAASEFGLNMSAVFEKTGSKWLIRAMHFSNLTSGNPTKA